MGEFFVWYIVLVLLGWLTFPLTFYLFPALPERGYTLSRVAGLLLWGYIFWLLTSLGITKNNTGGIVLAFVIPLGLSFWAGGKRRNEILGFLRDNKTVIIVVEILFLISLAFLAFVRSANPELNANEKPMELAFINGILRSTEFPPRDPWLSGYSISYYYFGYVMTAMLARLSNVNGSTAHNLMISLVFSLSAIGSFGVVYNLLSLPAISEKLGNRIQQGRNILHSLFAPVFLLLVSNLEVVFEILHKAGLFWVKDPVTGNLTSSFWSWLNIPELTVPPMGPPGLMPDRFNWWWRASRVIQDYDMIGRYHLVIDEFPFFSFLVGDLHPHVFALPFILMAVAMSLNLFLGGSHGGKRPMPGVHLRVNFANLLFFPLILGGFAFLNTWDVPMVGMIMISSHILWRAHNDGWTWFHIKDTFLFGLPLGILSFLLYLPFHLGFSSEAGGILPNFMYPTRGIHLWIVWGTLLVPIFTYLANLSFKTENWDIVPKARPDWKLGFALGIGIALFLFSLTLLIGWLGTMVEKEYILAILKKQGFHASQFIIATTLRRLARIGSLATLLAILIPAIAVLFSSRALRTSMTKAPQGDNQGLSIQFSLLLLIIGALFILIPEFVFVRDGYDFRMNTVYKFYYQAWTLWSLAASFGIAVLLQKLNGASKFRFRILVGSVIVIGLLYPSLSLMTKTNNFKPAYGFNLNDFDRIKREDPHEAAGIEFLLNAPDGVVAEAVGESYSAHGRISMLTGLQTVLGWPGHEAQWHQIYETEGSRREDIARLYTTSQWDEARAIIERYNIRYIYIGMLERTSMEVDEEKFRDHLEPVFQQGGVMIYEVPSIK